MENSQRGILQMFLPLVMFKQLDIPSTDFFMGKQCFDNWIIWSATCSSLIESVFCLLKVFCLPLESAILTLNALIYLLTFNIAPNGSYALLNRKHSNTYAQISGLSYDRSFSSLIPENENPKFTVAVWTFHHSAFHYSRFLCQTNRLAVSIRENRYKLSILTSTLRINDAFRSIDIHAWLPFQPSCNLSSLHSYNNCHPYSIVTPQLQFW